MFLILWSSYAPMYFFENHNDLGLFRNEIMRAILARGIFAFQIGFATPITIKAKATMQACFQCSHAFVALCTFLLAAPTVRASYGTYVGYEPGPKLGSYWEHGFVRILTCSKSGTFDVSGRTMCTVLQNSELSLHHLALVTPKSVL